MLRALSLTLLSPMEIKRCEHGSGNSDHYARNDSDTKTPDATKYYTGSSTTSLDSVLPSEPPQDRIDDPSACQEGKQTASQSDQH
jgi:hypothetical protein